MGSSSSDRGFGRLRRLLPTTSGMFVSSAAKSPLPAAVAPEPEPEPETELMAAGRTFREVRDALLYTSRLEESDCDGCSGAEATAGAAFVSVGEAADESEPEPDCDDSHSMTTASLLVPAPVSSRSSSCSGCISSSSSTNPNEKLTDRPLAEWPSAR